MSGLAGIVEHMFELGVLRERIREMETTRVEPRVPTHPLFARLLGGGLKPGSVYSVSSSLTVAMVLAAGASGDGAWCASVGIPHLGAQAAHEAGINLERFVTIPYPGTQWPTVVGALVDSFGIVLARSPGDMPAASAARIAAVARRAGSVLIVVGDWPGAEARIQVVAHTPLGVHQGHGLVVGHDIAMTVTGKGATQRAVLPWPLTRELPAPPRLRLVV